MYNPHYTTRAAFVTGVGMYLYSFEEEYLMLVEKWYSVTFPKDLDLIMETAHLIYVY